MAPVDLGKRIQEKFVEEKLSKMTRVLSVGVPFLWFLMYQFENLMNLRHLGGSVV